MLIFQKLKKPLYRTVQFVHSYLSKNKQTNCKRDIKTISKHSVSIMIMIISYIKVKKSAYSTVISWENMYKNERRNINFVLRMKW